MSPPRSALQGPAREKGGLDPEARARAYLEGHAQIATGGASERDVANALTATAMAWLLRCYPPAEAARKIEAAIVVVRRAQAGKKQVTA